MTTVLNPNKTIGHREVRSNGTLWASVYSPARPLPDDAPQPVKDLAAQHWTPEVIQAAKDRIAGAKPK
jgi:hypothetical protein